MKMPLTKPCPCCGATGRISISAEHKETLTMLLQRKRPISGADLARVAGINPTAMNNRLVELEKLGLATGTWAGRKRLWVSGKQEAAR